MTEFFTAGLLLYRKREFAAAITEFERALQRAPSDYPSKLYIQRSLRYIASPPPPEWDGVFTLESK
jgi:hypothetical protein